MNVREVIKRMMGKGSNIAYRDPTGMPVRKATTDDLELEQYQEEDRRHRVHEVLLARRKERLQKAWQYNGYEYKVPGRRKRPCRKPSFKKKKNILKW